MKKTCIILFVCLLLFGCARVSVNYQGEVPARIAEVKATYGWYDELPPSSDVRIDNPTIIKFVRDSVDKRLAEMGYKRVTVNDAEYLIAWFGNVEEEVKDVDVVSYYARDGYRYALGARPENSKAGKVQNIFTRGTLILDVLDPATREVVWRGSATNTILEGDKGDLPRIKRYIDTSVAKILETLPQ
jgi:hypothetical protein